MDFFTIGKLARQAGVNIETVRYYERIGLLPEPERNESGYRQYSEEYSQQLKFVKNAQRLGFSLKQVKELLSLKVIPGYSCADVKKKAEQKIEEIEAKITELKRIKAALIELSGKCDVNLPARECRILEVLSKS
ncbi:MAG: heavy metal-responsive transcriptional regulator [Spirochaetes bacterium]|nr:heavy metal-responsive transcriptional regulator [Spirochaetota bacterium]